MNIFVCIKQVPDTGQNIRLAENSQGIDETNVEWVMNPYDEFALEAALQIREKTGLGTIEVLSIGPPRVETALRRALAMGADKACLVEHHQVMDPFFVTAVLAEVIKTSSLPHLILMGKVGVDENQAVSGPFLAERLGMNHIGFVTKLVMTQPSQGDGLKGEVQVQRLMNGVEENIRSSLPVLITVDKGMGQPRYPSLPGIIQAKKKPLKKIPLSELQLPSIEQQVRFHSYRLPDKNTTPCLISGPPEEQAKELIRYLRDKEKVI